MNRPISVTEFNSNCTMNVDMGSGADFCGGELMRICKDFQDMLSETFPSRAVCMQKSRALYQQQYQAHVVDGCRAAVEQAFTLCGQFCARNYPQ